MQVKASVKVSGTLVITLIITTLITMAAGITTVGIRAVFIQLFVGSGM